MGDQLTQDAIATGPRTRLHESGPEAPLRLTILLPDEGALLFRRPPNGTCADWRVADFESPGGGCLFDEPVSATWGRALDHLAKRHLNP
ncbi:hypothetical protein [Streptomyces sp. NPDC049555]|uniref:hypothetical protein n=1 Tax=Streptomyces sp. NPDC049555 TaxID=3154930 RepID=UPI00343E21F5